MYKAVSPGFSVMANFVQQTQNQLVSRELDAGAVSSPIQNIPPETLNEIFQWFLYLNGDHFYEEPISLALAIHTEASYPTLKLSWVCSRWRNLVIALPALWSVIFFRTRSDIELSTNVRRREMLLHYISLSRNVPLTFILDGKGTIMFKGSDLHFIVNTMLDNLHRWGSVHLMMSEKWNRRWLETFLKEKRPAVDQLTNGDGQTQIRTLNGELVDLQVPNLSYLRVKRTLPVQLLTACPKLHTLEIIESLKLPDFSRCDFANLKTLHAGLLYGAAVVVDVIRQTPMLDELHIGTDNLCIPDRTYAIAEADRVPVSNPPYCSRVTSLSVSVNCLWPGAWKNILFPHLQSLSVTTSHYDYEDDISTAIMTELAEMLLLSCSQAHLEDVHSMPLGLQRVTFNGIPAPMIVNILRSLPSVSQLTLTSAFGKKTHDEVFALMSVKPFVVPHLRTLSLADSYCEHYTYTDPHDLETYSDLDPRKGDLCCLARDIFSMIKTRNESSSCQLQQLVLPRYTDDCLDLELLKNQLAPLGVTVVQAE